MDTREYYDSYVDRQKAAGVNDRHRSILKWLLTHGLKADHRVLEVGCGIGTVTGLIRRHLTAGSITAIDLSPESIEVARQRLGEAPNLHLRVGDILSIEVQGTFDVVVLPDVIEHIPIDEHAHLFAKLAELIDEDGWIFLHYPSPWYQIWCRRNHPALLQIIDQPVYAHDVAQNAHNAGLYLDFVQTYSIWRREGDYVAAGLKRVPAEPAFSRIPIRRRPILVRLWQKIRGVSQ